ncbi:MAG: hypothetical protein ABS949_14345 [Solibacillus sp.]
MKLTESNRKYILAGIVAFVLVGLFVANFMATKQDEAFMQEDMLYQQAIQMLNEGNFIDAYAMLQKVLETQPNSEDANYAMALVAANSGEFGRAAIAGQKTLDLNPYKVEDPIFMLQFGEILVSNERFDDAKTVLLECQKQGWEPEEYPDYQQRVTSLLAQIETK